jgi:insulysin
VAQDLSLVTKDSPPSTTPLHNRGVPIPSLLADGDDMRIYYAPDDIYRVPKLSMLVTIRTPAITARHSKSIALAELYIKCVQETLANASYDAQLAGLEATFKATDRGIEIAIHGFNDKIRRFFETVAAALPHPYCDQERFYQFKDTLLRNYADYKLKAPIEQAIEAFKNLIYENYATAREKESALRRITLADYEAFVHELYAENFIEGVIYGNITADDARQLVQQLQTSLGGQPYPPARQEEKKVLLLPDDEGPFYYEETIPVAGNAIVLAIEGGAATYQQRAIQQIAMQVLREGFYHALRTQQQTAYIVTSSGEELEGQIINVLAEQSHSHDGRDLLARFEMYLEKYLHTLESKILPESRFKELRDTFINQLTQPPRDMQEMGELLQQLAFIYHGDFERPTKRIDAFKALSYQTFVEQTNAMLGRQNHRRLAILLRGTFPEETPFHYERARSRSWLRDQGKFSNRT